MLPQYDYIIISPNGLDLHSYEINHKVRVEYFEPYFFEGIKGYNQLLLSEHFYQRFSDYKYIFIYQLDALIFKDDLQCWIKKDFDYVGAPWYGRRLWIFLDITVKNSIFTALKLLFLKSFRNAVGNGGVSLRKVDFFLNTIRQHQDMITNWKSNEDYYWSFFASSNGKNLKKPDAKEAVNFCIETNPGKAFRYLNDDVPFAVHAWEKYEREKWWSILEKRGLTELMNDRDKKLPKVSIITVTYNNKDNLLKTISNIGTLEYDHLEYIIVDGGSSDGTVEVLQSHQDIINRWISESDKGIYDAMNKGLSMATGDYVWFINAGDLIYQKNILNDIFEKPEAADVYYGDTIIIDEQGNTVGSRRLKPPRKLTWKSFQMGQLVSHQAFIAKRELAPGYDLNYQYSADIDWQVKILKKSNVIVNTHQVLCFFLSGGKSSKTIVPSLKERFIVMIRNYGWIKTLLNHFIISVKFFIYLLRYGRF